KVLVAWPAGAHNFESRPPEEPGRQGPAEMLAQAARTEPRARARDSPRREEGLQDTIADRDVGSIPGSRTWSVRCPPTAARSSGSCLIPFCTKAVSNHRTPNFTQEGRVKPRLGPCPGRPITRRECGNSGYANCRV